MSRSSRSDTAVNDLGKVLEDPPAKLDIETGKPQATSTYGPTDGGWDAWGTVLGATLVSMSTFG